MLFPELMETLVSDYTNNWTEKHPIETAALLHGAFIKTHPSIDGNGRTARLLMNFELMRRGYLPCVINVKQRSDYYSALDLANATGHYQPFIQLILDCEHETLDLWLQIVQ